jgi:hypothetical protein
MVFEFVRRWFVGLSGDRGRTTSRYHLPEIGVLVRWNQYASLGFPAFGAWDTVRFAHPK